MSGYLPPLPHTLSFYSVEILHKFFNTVSIESTPLNHKFRATKRGKVFEVEYIILSALIPSFDSKKLDRIY